MQDRLIQIARMLRDGSYVPADDVAARLGVSPRTVRSCVARLNDALAGAAVVEMRRGRGYELVVTDQARLDSLLQEGARSSQAAPSTPAQRVEYLLADLLYRTDWVTMEQLSQILFVSRTTLTEDMREVEATLSRFGLSLERKPYYGIRVTGPELKRRLCLASVAVDRVTEPVMRGRTCGDVAIEDVVPLIARCVCEATDEAGFQVSSLAAQNLVAHIAIAVVRIGEGCYVPMEGEQLARIERSEQYPVARAIAANVERAFDLTLPGEEVAYIAIHLAGRQSLYFSADAPESDLAISDEVWNVVTEMVERVWQVFRFDFRGDLELRMNLARHVVPLSVRLRYGLRTANPLLADIKARYALAWSMALECGPVLAAAYGAEPSEEEAGYIALAFALALDRARTGHAKKNILVVCASGAGSAHLLEHRFREEFGADLDRIVTCDAQSVRSLDLAGIDYVFTTVPLGIELPVPVREVRFFLDERDVRAVREALREAGERDGGYFSRDLFFSHASVRSRDEAIHLLCERSRARHALPDDFEGLVREREAAGPTCFGNQVAMPHPMRMVSDETFVAVALLDEPVDWDGHPVRAVFLVSVAAGAGDELRGFYRRFARLLSSEELMASLLERQSYEALAELMDANPDPRKAGNR